tara:strand:- start:211 stop:444 length:234 start_codon:yes stop_codon:yes gene_type:complete
MKLTLHKVIREPFEYPELIDNTTGDHPVCVVYLSEFNGKVEETEMLYSTFDEAYEESNRVNRTIEGVVIENSDLYDA